MADDLLLQALANQRKQSEQNNMWNIGAQALQGSSQAYLQNQDPYANPNDNLIGALITGLGSGFAKGMGQQQVKQEMADYTNSLRNVAKDYYTGADLTGYAKSPYQSISDIVPQLEFGRVANQYERNQKIEDEKRKNTLDFMTKQQEQGIIPLQGQDDNGKTVLQWGINEPFLEAKARASQITNPSFGAKSVDPVYQPIIAKVMSGQDLSPEDANTLSTAPLDVIKEIRANNSMNDVQSRFGQNLNQKNATKNIFGYDFLTDNKMTDSEAAKLREHIANTNVLTNVFDQIATNPDLKPEEVLGQNAAMTDALRAVAFQKLRMGAGTGANSGAALNPGEQSIITDTNFATMATDPIGSIKRMAMGRDQKQFAKDLSGVMQKLADEQVLSYGGVRSGVKPDYYSPQAIARYQNSNGLNDFGRNWFSQTGSPTPQGSPTASPTPDPSQFKKQINQKTGEVRYVPR